MNLVMVPFSYEKSKHVYDVCGNGKLEIVKLPSNFNKELSKIIETFISLDDKIKIIENVDCSLNEADLNLAHCMLHWGHLVGKNKVVLARKDDNSLDIQIQIEDGAIFRILILD